MGNLYSGIKRIDEAQRLLMKEYEENGLQFVLVTRPCETKHGTVFVGDPTELAAVLALQSTESNSGQLVYAISMEADGYSPHGEEYHRDG